MKGGVTFGRQVAFNTVANSAVPLSALLSAPLLAQALGATGRGEVAAAVAPTNLVICAATLGLPEAVVYYTTRDPRAHRYVVGFSAGTLLLVGSVCTVLTVLLAPRLSGTSPSLVRLIAFAALGMGPTLMLGAVRASAMAQSRWRRVNAEKLTLALLRLGLLVGAYGVGHLSVVNAVAVLVLSPIVAGVAYVGMPLGDAGRPVATPSLTRIGLFGMRSWAGAVAGILLSRLDQVLLIPLADAHELGLYAVAVNIGDVPLIVVAAAGSVLLAEDGRRSDDRRLTALSRSILVITVGVALLLAAVLPSLLPLVFGRDFTDAYWPATILLLTAALGSPGSVAGTALTARGRPGLRSTSLAWACVVNAVLVVTLVPVWGATGAAVAMLVGSAVATGLNIVFLRRHFDVPVPALLVPRPSDARLMVQALRGRRRVLADDGKE